MNLSCISSRTVSCPHRFGDRWQRRPAGGGQDDDAGVLVAVCAIDNLVKERPVLRSSR